MSLAPLGRRPEGGARGARASRRALGVAFSAALHLGALVVALNLGWAPPPPSTPASLTLTLVADPRPPAPEAPPSPSAAAAAAPTRSSSPRPLQAPRPRIIRGAAPSPLTAADPTGVSEAELSGAATAGGGGGGGVCDMAQLVQTALRKDPLVRAAVAAGGETPGAKAVRVWNGDWVTSGGQDGKGLAAVREAVSWEVGFAPRTCREAPVHGLVLISLADAPGAARFVIGLREWRWSDLLGAR